MAKKRNARTIKPGKPARVLIECSPHRTTGGGFFPGLTEADVEHESYIERYTVATLVLCHDVDAFKSQASKEPYFDGGRIRFHVPDFTVETFVPGLRIECKALSSLVRDDSLEKYAAVARGYRARNIRCAFLVDAQLEEAARFDSVKLLFRYTRSRLPETVLPRAAAALSDGPLTIRDLKIRASLELVDVWTLIARRHICFDWAKPLCHQTTVVSLPNQPFGGLKLEDILSSTRYGGLLEELALGRRPSDKYLLADAADWGQHHRFLRPWNFVGGFPDTTPLRDLGEEEYIPRAARTKRNFAPGLRSVTTARSI